MYSLKVNADLSTSMVSFVINKSIRNPTVIGFWTLNQAIVAGSIDKKNEGHPTIDKGHPNYSSQNRDIQAEVEKIEKLIRDCTEAQLIDLISNPIDAAENLENLLYTLSIRLNYYHCAFQM